MPFRQQISRTPAIDVKWWSFSVIGAVAHPVIWSYADLLAMPQLSRWSPIICPMTRISPTYREAIWRGVSLRALMTSVTPIGTPTIARIEGADGYSALVPSQLMDGALLALWCDDQPLTPENGAPARFIFPGSGGSKHTKWVERLTLTDSSDGGTWEARGGSLHAPLQPAAWLTRHIVNHGTVSLSGAALVPRGSARTHILLSISGATPTSARITDVYVDHAAGLRRLRWALTWRAPYEGRFPLTLWVDSGAGMSYPSYSYTLEVTQDAD